MKILTIITITRIIEVNPEDVDPIEAKIQVDSLEATIHVAEVNKIRTHTKANIKTIAIRATITRAIEDFIITHAETFLRVIVMSNLEVEAMAEAEAIIAAVVAVGPIIKVMLTINTISIMVTMMSTDQYGPPCALCGRYNDSPKHCFRGEHDINDIMEKMNINGHQSQSSSLYSSRGA